MNQKPITLAFLAAALLCGPATLLGAQPVRGGALEAPASAPEVLGSELQALASAPEVQALASAPSPGHGPLAAAPAAARDTVIPVERGTRLMVKNHQGSITVRTWDRPAVRLEPSPADVRSLQIAGDGKLLRILSGPGPGAPRSVDLVLTVPAEMALDLAGPFTDVAVEATRGQVTIETVNGDASVRGGASVSIRSVSGDVSVRDARGAVQIHSVSGDVQVNAVEGDVAVEAISGDVTLRGVRSDNVRVSTVSGDVLHDGELRDGGRYRLATHAGSVIAVVPAGANVTVAVRTYAGEFESSFPITLQPGPDRRFEFALGDGSARLELEAFSGELRLVRPGELPAARR